MNTPTHLVMTAAFRKWWSPAQIPLSAALLGSIAPDLPLYGLTFGGIYYFTQQLGWTIEQAGRRMFDTLYFQDPWWIGLHNVLHSPTSLALMILVAGWRSRVSGSAWSRWWLVFLLSCGFHSAVDIVTHYDDGPLLFWPFNWQLRFQSPISYWDPNHYGRVVSMVELLIFLGCLVYILLPFGRGRDKPAIPDDAAS